MTDDDSRPRLQIPPSTRRPQVNAPDWHEALGMPIGYETCVIGEGDELPSDGAPNTVPGPWRPVNAIGNLVPVDVGMDGRPKFGLSVSWAWIRPLYAIPNAAGDKVQPASIQ